MKIMRAGAFAGSLLLFPQLGLAEEQPVWTSAQPVWVTSSGNWLAPAVRSDWSPNWLKGSIDWTPPTPKATIDAPVEWRRSSPPESKKGERSWLPSSKAIGQVADPLVHPQVNSAIHSVAPPIVDEILDVAPRVMPSAPTEQMLPSEPSAKIVPPSRDGAPPATIGRPAKPANRLFPHLFGSSRSSSSTTSNGSDDGSDTFSQELRNSRFSMSAEYLLWWANNDHVPVLASTGTPQSGGILGNPGTRTLFGPGAVPLSERQGARFRALFWFDNDNTCGIDGSYMFLSQRSLSFNTNSNANPVISRPVFVLNNNSENAETVALPGFSTGSLAIDSFSRFWSMDVNLIKRLCASCDQTFDVFLGYRHLDLTEQLQIQEFITAGAAAPDPIGTQTTVRDQFSTRNQFNGGQIGTRYEQRWGDWFVNLRASVALGVNDQTLQISGSQVQTRPGQAPQTFQGGLLAAQSNIGRYGKQVFSVAPEVGLNFGYQITPRLRAFAGYNFLYWSNVIRPGEQIDRSVDLTQIPNTPPGVISSGQRRPAVLFHESSFLVHGVSFGMEWAW